MFVPERVKLAKVENIGGVPSLTVDGKPIGAMTFQWALGDQSAEQLKSLGKAGIELYFLRISISDPEKLDEFKQSLHEHVRVLKENVPNAKAIIWLTVMPYDGFQDKFPDDVVVFNDGKTGGWLSHDFMRLPNNDTPRFSHASEAWKHEVAGMFREVVREVNNTDLADTIIGYFLFSLCYEWSWFWDYDVDNRCQEYSKAMEYAFRNYLIEKYHGSLKALRAAWKDPNVTFGTAQLPSFEQKRTPTYGRFWDPDKSAQLIDYAEIHAETVTEKLEYFSKILKEESGFKAVVGSFWGYLMNQDHLWGGQARFKRMMDCPYLDFWSAPYTYENKTNGDFASMRYLIKSLQKHNKLYFAEADTFIHDSAEGSHKHHGCPMSTYYESGELLKRDYVYPLCEGTQAWWIDWSSGASQYDERQYLPLMRRMQEISRDAFKMPRGGVSDIAGIVDQESLITYVPKVNAKNPANVVITDIAHTPEEAERKFPAGLTFNAIDRFRVHELPRIGAPVDFYETDDVLDGQGRKHKMYIFMNNYVVDTEERERIEKYLKRDGNVLVFMYGAGLLQPNAEVTAGAENVTELTGIHMKVEMIEQRARMKTVSGASAILPGLKDGEEIGDFERMVDCGFDFKANSEVPFKPAPNRIDPVIYADDRDAKTLAEYVEGGKPAFVMKEFDNWTSIYVGSPAVQAYVLRAIAKKAGAHLYVDDEDIIVYANESFVGLHTATAGKRTIRLPEKANVCEAFDKREIGRNIDNFVEQIPAGTTRLYCLRPELLD